MDFTLINLKMCVFLDYFVIKYRTFDQSWALPDIIVFLEASTPPSQLLWVVGPPPQPASLAAAVSSSVSCPSASAPVAGRNVDPP